MQGRGTLFSCGTPYCRVDWPERWYDSSNCRSSYSTTVVCPCSNRKLPCNSSGTEQRQLGGSVPVQPPRHAVPAVACHSTSPQQCVFLLFLEVVGVSQCFPNIETRLFCPDLKPKVDVIREIASQTPSMNLILRKWSEDFHSISCINVELLLVPLEEFQKGKDCTAWVKNVSLALLCNSLGHSSHWTETF